MADNAKIQSIEDSKKSPEATLLRWAEEISLAEKEQIKFIDSGEAIYERYKDERKAGESGESKFNVFSTNVGILQSSLFAQIPKVEVTRRFGQDMDDVARVASMMIQNVVMQDMEDTDCNFAQVLKYSITDWLVPGWGVGWVRLEVESEEKVLDAIIDPVSGEEVQEETTYEVVTGQEACIEYVHWNDFIISPCRTYEERRWVGRKVYMSRDDLKERFGEEVGSEVSLDYKVSDDDAPTNEILEKAVVYEIWDRVDKKVIWYCKGYDKLLDEKEDPLQLEDFDPCPKPLFAVQSTGNYIPRADFAMLQDQYNELDEVNNRISLLVKACKVVGVYDSKSGTAVGRMLEEGRDNILIPVDNWAIFAESGGIKGAVDWLPIEKVIQALEKLRQAREDIKGQIYELTGISDIVRGNTKASETLGAQQIKAQFASVRIQKQQDMVASFAQQLLRMKAEIICKHFTPQQILKQSNFEFYLDYQNQALIRSALELIKGDYEKFQWRVNVEADSLAMADYQVQKQEKVEFINAVATFLQSAASVLQVEPELAPIMLNTLKFTISGFKGARELEGMIDKTLDQVQQKITAKANKPPEPTPEEKKMQQEMQIKEAEANLNMKGKQQDLMYNEQKNKMELQFKALSDKMDLTNQQKSNMMDLIKKSTDMILDKKAKQGRPEKQVGGN